MGHDVRNRCHRVRNISQRVIVDRGVERWCEGDTRSTNFHILELATTFDVNRVHGLGGVVGGVRDENGISATLHWDLCRDA